MESIQTEREDKFDVDADFQLPTLTSLVPTGGALDPSETDLSSEYFDTPGHDLLRRGITVRRRTGDTDNGWHAKVPAEKARTEIRLPLGSGAQNAVPDELNDVLRGAVMGGELSAVATLTTRRTIHTVSDAEGAVVAEIADDEVSVVLIGGATGPQWREVEVELGPAGSESFLKKAGKVLRAAGARPSAHPSKLDRALSVVRQAPAEPGAALLADYLDDQAQAIVAGDVYLRSRTSRPRTSRPNYLGMQVFSARFETGRCSVLGSRQRCVSCRRNWCSVRWRRASRTICWPSRFDTARRR